MFRSRCECDQLNNVCYAIGYGRYDSCTFLSDFATVIDRSGKVLVSHPRVLIIDVLGLTRVRRCRN